MKAKNNTNNTIYTTDAMNNNLINKPYTPTRLEEERSLDLTEKIAVKLNKEEQELVRLIKNKLHQPKKSTALKQASYLFTKVGQPNFMDEYISLVLNNDKKNKRNGIVNFD